MSFHDFNGKSSSNAPPPLYARRDSPFADQQNDALGDRSGGGDGIAQYMKLCERVKSTIFGISANIASIQRMVSQIGTVKDTHDMRNKLQNLTHATQELIKKTTEDLKQLTGLPAHSETDGRVRRLEQQKLSKDFQVVLSRFQSLQRTSAEKSREHVARAKAQTSHLETSNDNSDDEDGSDRPMLKQEARRQQELVRLDNEIEYNEAIIADREQSIVEIEHAIHEVNEIFQDLGSLVTEQQGMIDNIESNIETSAARTGDATIELTHANRYQKSAGKKMIAILVIFIIVVSILLTVFLARK